MSSNCVIGSRLVGACVCGFCKEKGLEGPLMRLELGSKGTIASLIGLELAYSESSFPRPGFLFGAETRVNIIRIYGDLDY